MNRFSNRAEVANVHSPTDESATLLLAGICPLLQVFDMPASLRFYRDVLGFSVVESSAPGAPDENVGWARLGHGTAEMMLNTAYDPDDVRPQAAEPRRVAAHGDTILFLACPDVDAAYRYLRNRGIDVEPPKTAPYGMRQLYMTDPDGFGLCLQWPVTYP